MQAELRKVMATDLQRVKEIENSSFPQTPYDILTFIAYWVSYPESFLVYENGDEQNEQKEQKGEKGEKEIKGYIIFDPYDGHIISIAVDHKYRRMGIGSTLIAQVLVRVGKSYVEVRESNEEAIEFYRSLGFEKVDRAPKYYVNEDALIMVKEIE